jgi:hypothetical protein
MQRMGLCTLRPQSGELTTVPLDLCHSAFSAWVLTPWTVIPVEPCAEGASMDQLYQRALP